MPRRYPPGPTNFNAWCGFTWRHAWRQLTKPLEFVAELAERYGDIAFYRLFIYEAYQLNHPDLIREVLVTKAASFRKQPRQRELIERIAGPGILTTEGSAWVRKRRMMLPAFQGHFGQQMANAAVREVHRQSESWYAGQEIDLYQSMTDLMLRAVGGAFFRLETAEETRELAQALHTLAECFLDRDYFLVRLSGWIPQLNRKRQRDAEAAIARYFSRAIVARRNLAASDAATRGDLLSLLLAAIDREGDGGHLTEREVLAEARTMFFAGHHTAAACLTWTLHLLARHPQIRERVLEEIGDVLQNRLPTVADAAQLTYTTQVLQESMRLYPPAWALFAREAIEPVEIGGYTLPPGAWIFIYPWVVHRDARFFPDPLRFDPERFSAERIDQIPTGAYIPFGLGSHSCLGGRVAMTTLQVALPAILQQFTFEEVPGQPPVELRTAISLRPKRDLRMRLSKTPPAARS
jgi:cytochrome P450